MRIVVAMSGGVDSSVAAALLIEEGHDVVGLSMQLYDHRDPGNAFGSCCSLDDLHDARRVAATLGIPHYVVNFERQFQDTVVADFVREYGAGRTPLPCAHCNSDLKYATLLERARGLDAEYVATGHYVRVHTSADGSRILRRGRDTGKDQSYFLFALTQAQLAHARFPVGDWDKARVRRYATERGLPVADKPDSQELCFVPDGDYAGFVEERLAGRDGDPSPTAGAIVDTTGQLVGRHGGIHRFTVGQRRGLGVSSSRRLYVVELRSSDGTVVVGPRSALERRQLVASDVNWIAGSAPAAPLRVRARVRSRHEPADAVVEPLDDGHRAQVVFDEPQGPISPGQAVVFYDDDTVVGGGWIDEGPSRSRLD